MVTSTDRQEPECKCGSANSSRATLLDQMDNLGKIGISGYCRTSQANDIWHIHLHMRIVPTLLAPAAGQCSLLAAAITIRRAWGTARHGQRECASAAGKRRFHPTAGPPRSWTPRGGGLWLRTVGAPRDVDLRDGELHQFQTSQNASPPRAAGPLPSRSHRSP
jgi:hypothetical protein